jgi:hypothetical protein
MKLHLLTIGILTLVMQLVSNKSVGQTEALTNTKVSLARADPKSLTRYFNDYVEISFDGEKNSYSKTQAEFVMKDFFKKYPPVSFELIHQGASKEGLRYAIGKYSFSKGSYRVYILIKQFKGNYLIDTLNFSEE